MRTANQIFGDPGTAAERTDGAAALLKLRDQLSASRPAAARARSTGDDAGTTDGAAVLAGAIETEIIPRLLLAHRRPEASARSEPSADLTPEDRRVFLQTVLRESAAASRRLIDALLQRGVHPEVVFLDLLAGCARSLGQLWEEDQCDFAEVTIGLCRLHQILRELSVYEDSGVRARSDAPRVLLATACGDQHVFGVVMVAEFFRREGWQVWSEPGASRAQLSGLLAERIFDLLGISAACSMFADDVAAEIRALRKASRNRDLKVMIGGRLIDESPDLVDSVGADGSAPDAITAPSVGYQLLSR